MFRHQIKTISSNSPNITYQVIKDLPKGLSLNNTGEIWGKPEDHGKYNSKIQINDGTNQLSHEIKFLVLPKDSLSLDFIKSNDVFKNEEFIIPILVRDADRLLPKFHFVNKKPNRLNNESTKDGFLLKGTFIKEKKYDVIFEIEDTYNRKLTETISIICREKSVYTINWKSPFQFNFVGEINKKFKGNITAEIIENPKQQLKYYLLNKKPANIILSENGEFSVNIKKIWYLSIRSQSRI